MSVALSQDARTRYATSDVPTEALEAYGYILLAVSGADGEVSPKERRWFDTWAEDVGATAELKGRWSAFDPTSMDLQEFISSTRERRKGEWSSMIKAKGSVNYARTLVYDAIRMARADEDYHSNERDAVHKAAAILHVEPAMVLSIESLVDMEDGLRNLRRSLFTRMV